MPFHAARCGAGVRDKVVVFVFFPHQYHELAQVADGELLTGSVGEGTGEVCLHRRKRWTARSAEQFGRLPVARTINHFS